MSHTHTHTPGAKFLGCAGHPLKTTVLEPKKNPKCQQCIPTKFKKK
jgi:hypothetical protein